jgi:DNA ligase (NAD+)
MEKVNIPLQCPSCNSTLVRVNNQLFCKNPNCNEQSIKRVANYAKVLKIKGLGEKTIEKLGLTSISDIYSDSFDWELIIGTKVSQKIQKEIEATLSIPFYKFLAAVGIPLVGQAVANKLSFVSDPDEINYGVCKKAGIGDKATQNILNWLDEEYYTELINLPIEFTKDEILDSSKAIKICITGKLPGFTKSEFAASLVKAGHNVIVENDVSKDINYLVCETRKNSIKEQKALKLNIPILSLKEFLEKINE